MSDEVKRERGRPQICTKELTDEICRRLMLGQSLNTICKDEELPCKATVCLWLAKAFGKDAEENHKYFLDQYYLAREVQAETMVDEMQDIADDGTNDYVIRVGKNGQEFETVDHEHVKRSQLRIDTRKWCAERLRPKRYSINRQQIELSGKEDNPLEIVVKAVKIAETQQGTDQKSKPNESKSVEL